MDMPAFEPLMAQVLRQLGLHPDPALFGAVLADEAGGSFVGERTAAVALLRAGIDRATPPFDLGSWALADTPAARVALSAWQGVLVRSATDIGGRSASEWLAGAHRAATAPLVVFLAARRTDEHITELGIATRADGDAPIARFAGHFGPEARHLLARATALPNAAVVGADMPRLVADLHTMLADAPLADLHETADALRRAGQLPLLGSLGLADLAGAVGAPEPADVREGVVAVALVWDELLRPRLLGNPSPNSHDRRTI